MKCKFCSNTMVEVYDSISDRDTWLGLPRPGRNESWSVEKLDQCRKCHAEYKISYHFTGGLFGGWEKSMHWSEPLSKDQKWRGNSRG